MGSTKFQFYYKSKSNIVKLIINALICIIRTFNLGQRIVERGYLTWDGGNT